MTVIEADRVRELTLEGITPRGLHVPRRRSREAKGGGGRTRETADTVTRSGTPGTRMDLVSRSRTAREGITDTSGGIRQVGGISM